MESNSENLTRINVSCGCRLHVHFSEDLSMLEGEVSANSAVKRLISKRARSGVLISGVMVTSGIKKWPCPKA